MPQDGVLPFFKQGLIGNSGDIQSFMGQNSGLQKIAEDTIDAVRLLFSDKNRAEQVIQMVKAYIQNLNAKDLEPIPK